METLTLKLIVQIIMVIVIITYVIIIVVMEKRHKKEIRSMKNTIKGLRDENFQLIAKLRGYLIDLEHKTITLTEERPWRRIYIDLVDLFCEPPVPPYSVPMMQGMMYKVFPGWKIIINGRTYDSSSELENKIK